MWKAGIGFGVLAACLAACSGVPDSLADQDASPPDSMPDILRSEQIPPGYYLEANVAMTTDDTLMAQFITDGSPVEWNVHSHGVAVIIHAEGTGGSDTIFWQAPVDSTYSVLWINRNAVPVQIDVTLRLSGAAYLRSWATGPAD